MHPNETRIANFYNAFQRTEAAAMAACYHPDVVFHDNAFGALQGEQVRAMWHMLCRSATDLQLTFSNVQADDRGGRAHWEARYTFSRTGRKVHNRIEAQFRFRDGLIIEHRDHFDFWRWSSQALGATGLLLGWTPFLRQTVQKQSRLALEKYMSGKHQ